MCTDTHKYMPANEDDDDLSDAGTQVVPISLIYNLHCLNATQHTLVWVFSLSFTELIAF